eukprot:sb/3468692/
MSQIELIMVENRQRKEDTAVQRIKFQPKYFYSYAGSFSKSRSRIPHMYGIESSDQSIADILQDQFCLNFSNPLNPDVVDPSFVPPQIKVPEPRLTPTPQLMLKALSELKSDSSPGPDGVPAILLKECAEELSAPLTLLWAESFNTGICPQFYKQGNVTPLFKKGDKARACNYRPVTLTSHVVKCYERVMRDHMVEFLESNDMFTNQQHGFRGGRSCLSQLLAHYDQMYQSGGSSPKKSYAIGQNQGTFSFF